MRPRRRTVGGPAARELSTPIPRRCSTSRPRPPSAPRRPSMRQEIEMDLETPLPRLIADTADRDPDRFFVEVAGTDVVLTYGQFHTDVLRWAGAFAAIGLGEGHFVATMLPNRVDSYHCWLGLSWLRAIEVPVNPLFVGSTLAYPINNARAEILVITAALVDGLVPIVDALPSLRAVIVLD